MKKIYLCFFILFMGCSPSSKTEYLSEYQNFVHEVKNDWKFYTEEDWKVKSQDFEDFSVHYYKKFKGELTPSEIVKVYRLDFAFHFYKGSISLKQLISGKYNEVLKEYLEDFWEEIKKISKEIVTGISDLRSEGFLNIVDRLIQ